MKTFAEAVEFCDRVSIPSYFNDEIQRQREYNRKVVSWIWSRFGLITPAEQNRFAIADEDFDKLLTESAKVV